MKSDEKRSHRLNHLLKFYLKTKPTDAQLFVKAKSIGISDSTAKDYVRTVKIQAVRSMKK